MIDLSLLGKSRKQFYDTGTGKEADYEFNQEQPSRIRLLNAGPARWRSTLVALCLIESCFRSSDVFICAVKMQDELAARTSLDNYGQGGDPCRG